MSQFTLAGKTICIAFGGALAGGVLFAAAKVCINEFASSYQQESNIRELRVAAAIGKKSFEGIVSSDLPIEHGTFAVTREGAGDCTFYVARSHYDAGPFRRNIMYSITNCLKNDRKNG